MNKLLNYLNDVNMDENTERIINGQLQAHSIQAKVQEFNSLPVEKRYTYMGKLTERISHIKKPHKLLSVLLLLDHIHQCNPRITMPQTFVNDLQVGSDKESIILANIISYYHYFLKCNIANRFNIETLNPEDQFSEVENYCEISVMKILEFLKICFVFEHGILQLNHKVLIKSIVRSILVRFRQDLKIINIFLKNNLQIVLQKTVKHPLVNRIYSIYQKTLQINRSIAKLQNFNSIIQGSIQFPRYEVNIELNRQLQFAMRERNEEKERMAYSDICSEKQIIHDCYVEEQRSIHTNESFLMCDQGQSLL